MKYKVIIFDRSQPGSQLSRVMYFADAGYAVEHEYHYHERWRGYSVGKAWIEFDTEDEAALFKLTYL